MTPIKKSFICQFRWIILTGLNIYFAIISHKSPKSFIRHVKSELRSTFMPLKSEIYRKQLKNNEEKIVLLQEKRLLGLEIFGPHSKQTSHSITISHFSLICTLVAAQLEWICESKSDFHYNHSWNCKIRRQSLGGFISLFSKTFEIIKVRRNNGKDVV